MPYHVWESQHHHACPSSFDPDSLGMKTPHRHTTRTPKGRLAHPPSPRSAPDPFGTPHAQLWKLLSRDALGPLPGGSLARPTQASCLLLQCWSQRGGGGLSLLPLALWRLPAVAWGRVSLFPGGGGDEHRRRPPGGATWSLESAERIRTPGWVVLRLRTRCDCRPLAMLCWRRCYVITVR